MLQVYKRDAGNEMAKSKMEAKLQEMEAAKHIAKKIRKKVSFFP